MSAIGDQYWVMVEIIDCHKDNTRMAERQMTVRDNSVTQKIIELFEWEWKVQKNDPLVHGYWYVPSNFRNLWSLHCLKYLVISDIFWYPFELFGPTFTLQSNANNYPTKFQLFFQICDSRENCWGNSIYIKCQYSHW